MNNIKQRIAVRLNLTFSSFKKMEIWTNVILVVWSKGSRFFSKRELDKNPLEDKKYSIIAWMQSKVKQVATNVYELTCVLNTKQGYQLRYLLEGAETLELVWRVSGKIYKASVSVLSRLYSDKVYYKLEISN